MNSNPEISIIMPLFNSSQFIPEAIQSILSQTYQNFEVILVDDGSTDDSFDIVKKFHDNRLNYFYQENKGPGAARNTGIRKARGNFISFLDADDIFPLDKFNLQIEEIKNDLSLMFVAGRIQYITANNSGKVLIFENIYDQTMVNVHLGSTLCRKEIFNNDLAGMFDEDLIYSEDVDWWLRILEKNLKFKILPEITLIYRQHENNMTRNEDKNSEYFLKAIKKSLDRRRTGNNKAGDLPRMSDFSDSTSQLYFNNPLVTIIVYNVKNEQNLNSLIDTIYDQNYRPFEIIVAGNYSDINLKNIVLPNNGIRYFQSLHPGLIHTIRDIINISNGEFITFISMNETWNQNKLRIQVNYMINNPDKNFSFTQAECYNSQSEAQINNENEIGFDDKNNKYYLSTLLARKRGLNLFDPLETGDIQGTDTGWLINRIKDSNAYSVIPRILVTIRN